MKIQGKPPPRSLEDLRQALVYKDRLVALAGLVQDGITYTQRRCGLASGNAGSGGGAVSDLTKLLTPPDDEGSAGEPKRKSHKKNKKKGKEKGESKGAAPAPSAAAAGPGAQAASPQAAASSAVAPAAKSVASEGGGRWVHVKD